MNDTQLNDTLFADRLRDARKAAGKSQTTLGEAAGVSAQNISACEKGKNLPTLFTAVALAKALGVSLDYLCGIDTGAAAAKSITRLQTIADVVGHLSALASIFPCSCGIKELPVSDEWASELNEASYFTAALYIANPVLMGFVERWNQMYTLYASGTIGQELFETWYEGELARLSEIPVPGSNRQPVKFGFEPVGSEEE